ncbi:MAG: zinc ribbon domain-containing protein [Oscillospiraceae bacterium]|nr:zinc ribbon domain-containing protein [Oscillospiraceae bacterium]
MVCGKCGTELLPGKPFCGRCGTRVDAAGMKTKKIKKASPIPGILAVLVVAVVAVLVIALSGADFTPFGKDCDTLVKDYLDCRYGGNRADVLEMRHDKVVSTYLKDAGMTEYEYRSVLTNEGSRMDAMYDLACGEGWTMSYTVRDQWNDTGKNLQDIQTIYEDSYGLSVDAVKNFEVEVKLTGPKCEKTITETIVLVKIDMFWYIA